MVNCCVPECTNYSTKTEQISYHKIPLCPTIQKAWITKIKRENLPPLKNCYVCSEHFEEACFEVDLMSQLTGVKRKRKLKKDAIPSLFSFSTSRQVKRRATSENRIKRQRNKEVGLCQCSKNSLECICLCICVLVLKHSRKFYFKLKFLKFS